MIRSMTGFGARSREIAGARYSVEIRSVNSRYFKAVVRLPDLWGGLEVEIDRRLRRYLSRGSVQFAMRMTATSAEAAPQINMSVLERYIEQLDIIRPDQADVSITVDLASLLLLPGVCSPPDADSLSDQIKSEILELADEAIAALIEMRTVEGKVIADDFRTQCDTIEQRLTDVAGRAGTVIHEYHERLSRRVAELTAAAELKLDEQDLAREIAIFAERCDIAEELSRLGGHIEQFRSVVGQADHAGRKLDFLAQEMLREANTIASKANDGQIAWAVVEIKTAIDRIKEQVQNVE